MANNAAIFEWRRVLRYVGLGVLALGLIAVCITPPNLTFTRIENFLLPLLLLVLIGERRIRFELVFFLGLTAFFGFYIVSIFLNGDGMADLSFAFRTLKILLFLVLGVQILYEHLPSLDRVIKGTFLFITLIMLLEYFNPMDVYERLLEFFTHHTKRRFEENDSVRIIGTMTNPNNNGVLLTCFIAYFMSAFYYTKNKWNLFFIMLGLILIMLSQSRTSLIAVLAMGAVFILTFKITKTMVLTVLGTAAVGIAIMYLLEMNYMLELLSTNPMEISAFKARFRDWGYVIEVWNGHKIWGVGPFTDTFTAAGYFDPDSEYLYIMGSRGLVGLMCYLIILIYPIVLFWRKRNVVHHGLLGVLLNVAFLLIGITNFSILNVRIGVLYGVLMAIPFSFMLFSDDKSKLHKSIPSLGSLFNKRI